MSKAKHLTPREIAAKALSLRDQDDLEAAFKLLSKAASLHPREALIWQTLGLIQRARLETREAIDALQRASSLAPSDERIAAALAYVTLEGGLPAIEMFDKAVALAPSNLALRIGRSSAQLASGQIDSAIADLTEACRASPLWLEGHGALADLHWLNGNEQEFVASYAEAIARQPHSLALWLAMVDRYQKVGRYDWAQQAVSAAQRVLGDKVELLPFQAICASELGDNARGDALFSAMLKVPAYNGNIALQARFLRHLLRCNRPEAAAEQALQHIGSPLASEIWPYLSIAWRMLGDARWQWLEGDARLVKRVKLYEAAELAELENCLTQIHGSLQAPAGQSVRLGSQTDGPLFARLEPEIIELRKRIKKAAGEHIRSLDNGDSAHPVFARKPNKVRFSGSWSVRLRGRGYHSNHIHPQGWLSSAFYVSVPEERLMGPAPAGYLQLGVPPHELGIDLPPSMTIKPEAGWLTFFPSIMWHGTAPIADGERLSVAFDVAPRR